MMDPFAKSQFVAAAAAAQQQQQHGFLSTQSGFFPSPDIKSENNDSQH
jgi:hypothetical protein